MHPDVITTGQGDIVPNKAKDIVGSLQWLCGGRQMIKLDDPLQIAIVILKSQIYCNTHPHPQIHRDAHTHPSTHKHTTNIRKQESTEYRLTSGQDGEEKETKTTHVCRLLYNNVLKWG